MRLLRIIFGVLLLTSAYGFADDIDLITLSAVFTGDQSCTTSCTEAITISFQFNLTTSGYPASVPAWAVPGTVNITSSGTLDSFSSSTFQGQDGYINLSQNYMPLVNDQGDEIDILRFWTSGDPTLLTPGINTLDAVIFSCASAACQAAGLHGGQQEPTSFYSSVTPLSVPEPSSLALIVISPIGFLVWRSRRRIADTTSKACSRLS